MATSKGEKPDHGSHRVRHREKDAKARGQHVGEKDLFAIYSHGNAQPSGSEYSHQQADAHVKQYLMLALVGDFFDAVSDVLILGKAFENLAAFVYRKGAADPTQAEHSQQDDAQTLTPGQPPQ